MSLPAPHPVLKEARLSAFNADSSAATSAFTSAPWRGKIVKLGSVAGAAVDSDRLITAKINGTAITGGAVTLTASGSAAGDVHTWIPTALNSVNEDDTIEFLSDGAGSTACPHQFFAIVQMA